MDCDVCRLPDPYNGQGDGIGSCDCPRCDCGTAAGSWLCICPPDDVDEYWPSADNGDPEVVSVRPGETPREITDTHLPEG